MEDERVRFFGEWKELNPNSLGPIKQPKEDFIEITHVGNGILNIRQEKEMKKDTDIGFFTKILLKIITFLQVACLKQDNTLYYPLTKLHFKLYFGKNLVDEAVNESREFKAAQKRHTAMVMINVFKVIDNKKLLTKVTERSVREAFQKNLLLEVEL